MKFIELLSRNEKKIQEFGNFMRLQGVVKDTTSSVKQKRPFKRSCSESRVNYSSFRKRLE